MIFTPAPVPPPGRVFGYNFSSNHLVSFDASAPGTLLTDVTLTGLNASESSARSVPERPSTA